MRSKFTAASTVTLWRRIGNYLDNTEKREKQKSDYTSLPYFPSGWLGGTMNQHRSNCLKDTEGEDGGWGKFVVFLKNFFRFSELRRLGLWCRGFLRSREKELHIRVMVLRLSKKLGKKSVS